MSNTKAPRLPVSVSSMSSLDSSASAQHTAGEPATALPEASNNTVSSSTLSSMTPSPSLTSRISLGASLSSGQSGMLLSASVPMITTAAATVPAPTPNNNTVAEFIFQLTKMLTDDNREVIEWANGQINVHDPHKLASTVMHKYFRHSKFASFQRQLNYFGFRKLAGKGKMSPCSYTNEQATSDLRSLLLIKRKATATPSRSKDSRKRERTETAAAEPATANVNPVLAGILHRTSSASLGKRPKTGSTPLPSALIAVGKGIKHGFTKTISGMPSSSSHQELARAAVGKGVRHGYSVPSSATTALLLETMTFPDPPPLQIPDIQDSLSELTNNYRNSLQDETMDQTDEIDPSFNMYHFLRRDSSLVDLAMLVPNEELVNMGSVEPTPVNEMRNSTATFVDFPHQDFDPSNISVEFEE